MLELLTQFSMIDIITIIVALAVSVRSVIAFWDFAVDRLRRIFNKESTIEKEKAKVQERLQENYDNLKKVSANQEKLENQLSDLGDKINLLIESDKDDIKSFLTREHHYFCYQKKWIDDYSLECCEKRYQHYAEEGGNSFIEGFMNDLRALPKQPPSVNDNDINVNR